MKGVLAAAILAVVVLLLPAVAAQETKIDFTLASSHQGEMKLPESRKMVMDVTVRVAAQGFACVQPGAIEGQVIFRTAFPEWAGASVNPDDFTFTLAVGEPGVGPWTRENTDRVKLEIFWGEDRPKKNARMTYEIQVDSTGATVSGGPCAPTNWEKTSNSIQMTVVMDDVVETTNTTGPGCTGDLATELPECQTNTAPPAEGNSPGFEGVLLAAAIVGAVVVARRRR